MIEAYYHLKRMPFSKDIDPKDIFISQSIAELNRRLEYIKQKRGILLVTGEPGTGKTLIIRSFLNNLNQNLYKYFYIPLSTVNVLDFYRQLCTVLGGEPLWKKSQLFASIQNTIKHYVESAKKIPLIIFDEVHYLKNENFYELQIITNFHLDAIDPAIFILLGQPHLRDRLIRPIHQSFNQRITLKFHLSPLSKEETTLYIQHQLKYAGAISPIFEESAMAAIYLASHGIPRVINAIATNCLTIGSLEKRDSLSEEEVYRAVREIE
jgi:type II secretory pathway predicted ATPase ExeA